MVGETVCGECWFYFEQLPNAKAGTCREAGPRMLGEVDPEADRKRCLAAAWPQVSADTVGCGRFRKVDDGAD